MDQIFQGGIIYFRGGSDMFGGDQIFLAWMIYFSAVRILPKGSHKSGGPINRNRGYDILGVSYISACDILCEG